MRRIVAKKVKSVFKFLYWTPSALSTYIECPRKFKLLYLDGLTLPESNVLSYGKAFHQFAQYSGKSLLEEKKIIELHDLINGFKILKPKYYQILNKEKEFEQHAKNLYERLLVLKKIGGDFLKTEFPLIYQFPASYNGNEIWLKGRVDLLVKKGEALYIFDWKTGKIYNNQNKLIVVAYAYGTLVKNYQKFQGITEIEVCYFSCKTKKEICFPFKKHEFSKIEFKIKKIIEKIYNEKEFPKNVKLCKWCALKENC